VVKEVPMRFIDGLFLCVVVPCAVIGALCYVFLLGCDFGCDFAKWKASGSLAEVIVKPTNEQ